METQILDVLGVEVEIRAWRNRPATYEAHFTDKAGNPVDLSNSDARLTVIDRAGGTTKLTVTNNPANHADAGGGVSRFYVPASAFAGLSGQRAYTWKYVVDRIDLTSGDPVTHFYGDFRVMAPYGS